MTRSDFKAYLLTLKNLLNAEIPEHRETLEDWYSYFKNITLDNAKKMARLYAEKEIGKFQLSKLLAYRASFITITNFKCDFCNGTGFIQILELDPYEHIACSRCCCSKGDELNKMIRQVTKDEVMRMERDYMTFRRANPFDE